MAGMLPVIGTSTMLSFVIDGKLPFCPQELGMVPAHQAIMTFIAYLNAYVDALPHSSGSNPDIGTLLMLRSCSIGIHMDPHVTGMLPVIGTSTMLSLVTDGKLPFCAQELGFVPAHQAIMDIIAYVNADVSANVHVDVKTDVNAYVNADVNAYVDVVRGEHGMQRRKTGLGTV